MACGSLKNLSGKDSYEMLAFRTCSRSCIYDLRLQIIQFVKQLFEVPCSAS
jgi:hypothetical protein